MTFTATLSGITLPQLPASVQSVDVCFGEQRVWSLDLSVDHPDLRGRYAWPGPITSYLQGSTPVILRHSTDGTELAQTDATFSDAAVVTRIMDADGAPLALNKWGRLGKTLEAGNSGVQTRILDRTEELVEHLQTMGLRPFVVGGTLLGAVRDNALLPHDDDADLAYLSEHTSPVDVAREGFEVGHKLQALGYELVRHSATHMQLYFRDDQGKLDHYVDVFSAFFTDDGHMNQPFHVRGPMRKDQMLPFSTVSIQNRDFPAPADPEYWLTINYDENWRTPIPGYRLVTPPETIRRFRNWFGSFHFKRDYWNDAYQDGGESVDGAWHTGAKWVQVQAEDMVSPWLIDLGCGSGVLSAELQTKAKNAGHSRRVIAADYSPDALALAEARASASGFDTAHVNLYRTLSLDLPMRAGIEGPFDLIANHLIDHLGPHAIPNALRLIRMSLRSGGAAVATLYGAADHNGDPGDPSSWGLAPNDLKQRAADYGLDTEVTLLKPAAHERRRTPYGARFTLHSSLKEES